MIVLIAWTRRYLFAVRAFIYGSSIATIDTL
jgi:hypothetical protein